MNTTISTIQSSSESIFRHILVATDFSESAHRAFCDARSLADHHQSRLSFVHVLEEKGNHATLENPLELDKELIYANQRLKALADEFASEKGVDTIVVRNGSVADAVASLAALSEVDLLVIGTRGLGGLRKVAHGSVAEEILRSALCPVLTVGPRVASITHGPGFHSILLATDFGRGSAKAMPLALALARSSEAKLILLHMFSPLPSATGTISAYGPAIAPVDEFPDWEQVNRKRVLQELREYLPSETGLIQEPEYVVGSDFLPEGILTAVSRFHVDLIVMGANRPISLRTAAHIPWTAVHEVVSKAPCPVLTVAA